MSDIEGIYIVVLHVQDSGWEEWLPIMSFGDGEAAVSYVNTVPGDLAIWPALMITGDFPLVESPSEAPAWDVRAELVAIHEVLTAKSDHIDQLNARLDEGDVERDALKAQLRAAGLEPVTEAKGWWAQHGSSEVIRRQELHAQATAKYKAELAARMAARKAAQPDPEVETTWEERTRLRELLSKELLEEVGA